MHYRYVYFYLFAGAAQALWFKKQTQRVFPEAASPVPNFFSASVWIYYCNTDPSQDISLPTFEAFASSLKTQKMSLEKLPIISVAYNLFQRINVNWGL